jgi:hypothetical protein
VVILELRDLQEALTQKVQTTQREFTVIQERLSVLRRSWTEAEEDERPQVLAEQERLKEKQLTLAETVNLWRDYLREIETPRGEAALDQTLTNLSQCGVLEIEELVKSTRALMAMDPEERAGMFQQQVTTAANTPAGRMLERARTSYDLRNGGPAALQQAAVEFANRSNQAVDDAALAELESGMKHRDPIVVDLAARTIVQMLRFRALRSAEADVVRQAVLRLVAMNHPHVVPALIEVLSNPRTVYRESAGGTHEESNSPERLHALVALVERWRSGEVQKVIRSRALENDPQISNAATRALAAFPGEWG